MSHMRDFSVIRCTSIISDYIGLASSKDIQHPNIGEARTWSPWGFQVYMLCYLNAIESDGHILQLARE
ncbi:hypothetical protein C1J05_20035 [Sulfitobacter sp. JL08]|nr:hypothetical protein C1J05_20035 [Sulfitobacter sp. JL08]